MVPAAGGNHPVKIYYFPESSTMPLNLDPQGPLLFKDSQDQNPKVHCSSCHDPMTRAPYLLRISNEGSALCLTCHKL